MPTMTGTHITALCFFSVISFAIASENDWPHLRGPNYDGVSTEKNLTQSWSSNGPPIRWRINLGQGYSGFIPIDGMLYTQTQSRSCQYVVCLEAVTGRD